MEVLKTLSIDSMSEKSVYMVHHIFYAVRRLSVGVTLEIFADTVYESGVMDGYCC